VARASVAAEKAGFPTASIVVSGFLTQARAVAQSQGIPNLPIAEYPGVIMTHSKEELRRNIEDVLVKNIVEGLTKPVAPAARPVEPAPQDVVFEGTLDKVNEFFNQKLWTDGLPIIPPTLEKINEFLKFTKRSPDEVIGILLPENREATVWNVAVNGLMAGCHPEYMPILLAIVEAIAEPEFRIQDAGSTPGWEPLIILNGPITKELDFNYGAGVMRVGRQANTSIGRFLRLYMRNVAGLRIVPGGTDKGSIAGTFNVVLAENEDAVAELGWELFSVDRGFKRGENVVTVQSVVDISPPTYSAGNKALDHVEAFVEIIGGTCSYWAHTAAAEGKFYPLLVIGPGVAQVIARDGWTKNDIKRYLYENTRVSLKLLEKQAWRIGFSNFDIGASVEQGILPREYCESTEPNRMVPVFVRPEWIGIVVSGDPGRNQSKGYVQNHKQGPPVSKKIALPPNWEQMLKEARKPKI
jgi:hypothetical protein